MVALLLGGSERSTLRDMRGHIGACCLARGRWPAMLTSELSARQSGHERVRQRSRHGAAGEGIIMICVSVG